jgi:hypothetical protein
MSEKKELLASLKRLDDEIEILEKRRRQIAATLGRLNCPFKVGDRIEASRTGIVWQVTNIGPGYDATDYRLFGRKVLKGGGLGKLEHRLYPEWDSYKAVKP